jgi:hypothetical protein
MSCLGPAPVMLDQVRSTKDIFLSLTPTLGMALRTIPSGSVKKSSLSIPYALTLANRGIPCGFRHFLGFRGHDLLLLSWPSGL